MATEYPEIQQLLQEIFESHGVVTLIESDWVIFPGSTAKVMGIVHVLSGNKPDCSTQVDIYFSPWEGCEIGEAFLGMGQTPIERIQNALDALCQNTLHVLLDTFLGVDCSHQLHRRTISCADGTLRTLINGNLLIRSSPKTMTEFSKSTKNWMDQWEEFLASLTIPDGTHWIRLFYGQSKKQLLELEFLLDNEPWLEVVPRLEKLPWPTFHEYFSMRMFVVVQQGADAISTTTTLSKPKPWWKFW